MPQGRYPENACPVQAHCAARGARLDRAAADYGEAIRLALTDARGWRNRGMIRLYRGDNKGGVADYDKALRYDPSDVFSWNNRGQARLRLGDRQGAIADFRKALELRPSLPSAHDALQKLGALTREP
ncbi:tetratricopeptide repeat protein [Bradyrhizobium japonicum]|uniref:tetratricopeptide repeat protein n=1 Tax=Bradyrhizobium japonicum TaxID=375 RepID=UPI0004ADD2FC|nr:tetratricopeptide repeat protein [Bradyrhizobium japonicum]MBR0729704.1 tetratricopeptide repeat protein [Bradyrhizobium japonicum]MBR0802262.1 tetratricopeptide repeat protein [Bradyrhizobium japonicum]